MKKSNMKRISAIVCRGLVATGVLVTALTVRADDQKGSKDNVASAHPAKAGDTETCLTAAAQMNMGTIKFAQLASQKAENTELKRFARTLEQDHQKAQGELKELAAKHNVTLPTALDDKCKEELSRLEGLSGQEFDREFAKGAVEGHAMAVAHLEQASASAKDADVRQYTQKMLSQIKEHQRQSRKIASAVGIDQTTIASLESKAREGVGGPAARTETSTQTSNPQE